MSTTEKIHRILIKSLKSKVRKNSKIEKDNFRETAQTLLNGLKKQEQKCGEFDHLWRAIETEAFAPVKEKRSQRLFLSIGAVAASLLIIVTISLWKPDNTSHLYTIVENSLSAYKEGNIVLISGNLRRQIKNNTEVEYRSDGALIIPQKQIISSSKDIDDTERTNINHLIVPAGKRLKVKLSDGTKLYVNAGSQVAYPSVFNRDKRNIAVNGEVYLEVAHNPNQPFTVNANGFEVRVLGTKFNVSAYKKEKAEVLLVQGSVAVQDKDHRKLRLKPYELANIDNMNVLKVDRVDSYICWKDGLMILDNEPLCVALTRVSKYYGIRIDCDMKIGRENISGKLMLTDNVEKIIKNITDLVGAQYSSQKDYIKITKY